MLADKEHLEKWIEEGKRESRADAPPVEELLRSFSESLIHETTIKNCCINLGHRDQEGFYFNCGIA